MSKVDQNIRNAREETKIWDSRSSRSYRFHYISARGCCVQPWAKAEPCCRDVPMHRHLGQVQQLPQPALSPLQHSQLKAPIKTRTLPCLCHPMSGDTTHLSSCCSQLERVYNPFLIECSIIHSSGSILGIMKAFWQLGGFILPWFLQME